MNLKAILITIPMLSIVVLGFAIVGPMKNHTHEPYAFAFESPSQLESPYIEKANLYKGQLHCHTTNSDGVQSALEVVEAYKNGSYNFVVITDHDYVTPDPGIEDVLFIAGNEVSSSLGHLDTVNVPSLPYSLGSQEVIDWTRGLGGLVWLAHPDFYPSIEKHELTDISGYNGIEVYNYARNLNSEELWDYALTDLDSRITAIAVDDCHDVKNPSEFNGGWVMVFANSLNKEEIVDSLEKGNFYSTQGPVINSVNVEGNTISIELNQTSKITWIGAGGSILQETAGTTADSYIVRGNEKYVRIRVENSGHAWTNPIHISELIVHSALVSDSRVNPAQAITISGQVYYEGTTIPPLSGSSVQAYVDLNGENKAALGAIEADGSFTFPSFPAESSVGLYSYNVYTILNCQVSAQNQTVQIIVDSLKVSTYKTNLPSDQVQVCIVYAYDDTPVQNGNATYAGLFARTNTDGWATFNLSSLSTVEWGLIAQAISETKYGLTADFQNQTVSYAKTIMATFTIKADNPIANVTWNYLYGKLSFDSVGNTVVDVGNLGKPLRVEVDGAICTDWTYNTTSRQVVVRDVQSGIVLQWAYYGAELWIIAAFSVGIVIVAVFVFFKERK